MKHICGYISYCYRAVWLNKWFSIFTSINTYLISTAKMVQLTIKVYRIHFILNLMTNKCWFLLIFSKMSSKQNIFRKLFFMLTKPIFLEKIKFYALQSSKSHKMIIYYAEFSKEAFKIIYKTVQWIVFMLIAFFKSHIWVYQK